MRQTFLYIVLLIFGLMGLAQAVDTTRIQVKRGKAAQLPTKFAMGEPAFTTDTHQVFFGYSTGMEELLQRARFQGYTASQAQRMAAIWAAMAGKQAALGYTPVNTTDARLSDARTPLAHSQAINTVTGLQTALDGKEPAIGFTPVNTSDSRLSDARTPLAHDQAISTVTGLQTALDSKQPVLGYTPVNTTDSRLSDARTPLAHEQAITTVTGLTSALADKTDSSIFAGYTAKQRALVTDPRFVDSRTPLPHNQGIETITGLQTVLDGKQPALGFTPVNTTDARLSDARTPLAHNQAISTVTGLQTALDSKQASLGFTPVNTTDSRLSDARTPLAHNQATNTITGLDTALSAASSHMSNFSNPHSTTASQTGAEPQLGAPDTDGKVLSSTAMGVRMWVAPGAETRSTIVAKINETPANNSLPLHYKTSTGVEVFSIDPSTGTVTITGALVIK